MKIVALYVLSTVISAIAGMAIIGHLRRVSSFYMWYSGDVGMALSTALAVLLIGVALFLLTVLVDDRT